MIGSFLQRRSTTWSRVIHSSHRTNWPSTTRLSSNDVANASSTTAGSTTWVPVRGHSCAPSSTPRSRPSSTRRASLRASPPPRAVDTEVLAAALRRALAQAANIRFLPSHAARTISEEQDEFCVEGKGPEGAWSIRAHQVVNAMWERRLGFDRQLGIPPLEHLLHRLKFRVIGRIPQELRAAPSVSMVLGRVVS
jgi:hypothetical protein